MFVVVSHPYFSFSIDTDVPGPPSKPSVVTTDAKEITLAWNRPIDDGGSEITGYIIEKKDKFSARWHKANRFHVPEMTHTVSELTTGAEYQFRVSAENKAGVGTPSEPSDPVVAKLPFGKCNDLVIRCFK